MEQPGRYFITVHKQLSIQEKYGSQSAAPTSFESHPTFPAPVPALLSWYYYETKNSELQAPPLMMINPLPDF